MSRALPRDRIHEVLDALKESVSSSELVKPYRKSRLRQSGHDIQLKILQALPSLVQNYAAEVRSDALSTILQICSGLQNAKNFAVSNTAAATLQQLVTAVFDRVAFEDGISWFICPLYKLIGQTGRALEIPIVTEVKGDGDLVPVRPAANDAYKVCG